LKAEYLERAIFGLGEVKRSAGISQLILFWDSNNSSFREWPALKLGLIESRRSKERLGTIVESTEALEEMNGPMATGSNPRP